MNLKSILMPPPSHPTPNPTRGLKIVLRDGRSSVGVYKIGNGTRQGTVINIALACNLICVNWQQCVVVCASVTDFGNQ